MLDTLFPCFSAPGIDLIHSSAQYVFAKQVLRWMRKPRKVKQFALGYPHDKYCCQNLNPVHSTLKLLTAHSSINLPCPSLLVAL